MKTLFNKTGQSSATLGTEVKYMTLEQRNAAAVAASVLIVVIVNEPDAPFAVPPVTIAETLNVPPAFVVSPILNHESPLALKLAAVIVSVDTPAATSFQDATFFENVA
jgi:acyl-CoA hydrolase